MRCTVTRGSLSVECDVSQTIQGDWEMLGRIIVSSTPLYKELSEGPDERV